MELWRGRDCEVSNKHGWDCGGVGIVKYQTSMAMFTSHIAHKPYFISVLWAKLIYKLTVLRIKTLHSLTYNYLYEQRKKHSIVPEALLKVQL